MGGRPRAGAADDTDAIVRVDTVTICGTDLHIMKGDVPTVTEGRVLGHEAVGTITAVGTGVKNRHVGDRVLVSCITACGACRFCREGRYGQCVGGGGWILGHLIDGTQAEKVRVPFADTSTYLAPEGVPDEELLMLADILPTGYEVGVLNGHVRPGRRRRGGRGRADRARRHHGSPPLQPQPTSSPSTRRTAASRRPSDSGRMSSSTTTARIPPPSSPSSPMASEPTSPSKPSASPPRSSWPLPSCVPAGYVANIGVHGEPATLHLEDLWIKDVTITTGLVDTYSTPTLLKLVATRQVDATPFVTHHFALDDFLAAYDVFGRAAETGALKVVLARPA